jgi:hypothetical protein
VAPRRGYIGIPLAHLALKYPLRRPPRWELDQHSVAGALDDPPLVLRKP